MRAPLIIKICGLSTPATLETALDAGADMVGFVFFPPSPRHIEGARARELAAITGSRALKVALSVDASDDYLDEVVAALKPDLLQLHGRETPERVAQIRARFGLPVMKVLGVSVEADFAPLQAYEDAADRILFDAKPPKDATRPGGNGHAFDWSLLTGRAFQRPWMLSGGLNCETVAGAIAATRPPGIDVSSGVESQPGVKDSALIEAFVARARAAEAALLAPLVTPLAAPLGSARESA